MERSLLDVLTETIAQKIAETVVREMIRYLEGNQARQTLPHAASVLAPPPSAPSGDTLTTPRAAAFLGVSRRTLEGWRETPGMGPDFMKYGDSPKARVRYLRSALEEFQRRRR